MNTDLVGSIGVAMMLVAFLLNIADKLSNDSPFYICLNLIGAMFACTGAVLIKYVPFVILEGTWALISVWALYVYFKRDFKLPKFLTKEKISDNTLIWWTSQMDAEEVSFHKCHLDKLPKYMADEFRSRYGRSGRGRLWVPAGLGPTSIEWNLASTVVDYCAGAGGIIFNKKDLRCMTGVPGKITDLRMNPIN